MVTYTTTRGRNPRQEAEEQDLNRGDVAEVLAKPTSQELLGSSIPARLAYAGVDGEPRMIPIGFWWTGEHVGMATVPKSAKVRALRQNPRVALTGCAAGALRRRPCPGTCC